MVILTEASGSKLAGFSWGANQQTPKLCGRPDWLYAILCRNIAPRFGFTQPTQIWSMFN